MNYHRYQLRRLSAAACTLATVLAAAGCGENGNGSIPLAPGLLSGKAGDAGCGGSVTAGLGAVQLERAYQAQAMFAHGITGAGTTAAVILPYAGPRVAADLAAYSRRYGLPVPVLWQYRYGGAPIAGPPGSTAQGWVREGTFDLEMIHAMAPRAALVYVGVSSASAQPEAEYDQALAWLVTRMRVAVVNYSEGIPEAWGTRAILGSRAGLRAAARAGTTVIASAGDFGPAELEPPGRAALYDHPVIAWPASDPLATAVGGTRLRPDGSGLSCPAFSGQGICG